MTKMISAGLIALLLSGCALGPDDKRPETEMPAAWKADAAKDETIAPDWWKAFGSTELNDFMGRALVENNDLRAALHRIEQSRALARIAGASLLPSVDASANASVSRTDTRKGGTKATNDNSWNAGLDVSYELDLFGANRAGVEAAEADIAGSIYDRQALGLVVMGDVADTYFLTLNLRERARIAQQNLDNARDILKIVEARFNAGASSALEVAQEKTTLASTEASLAAVRQQEENAENALAVLLGATPQSLKVDAISLENLTVPVAAPFQPSMLLQRRPDIRSAEAALAAANADVRAARAAFFPTISLGAGVSAFANPMSAPVGIAVDAASSLLAPIFSGGRLSGQLQLNKARQAELLENYRKAILVSLQEVEDALAAVKASQAREKALSEGVEQARKSYDLSRQLYKSGAIDFQTLLDAQDKLLQTEDSYAVVRLEMLQASVDLYKALGGGWQSDSPSPAGRGPG